MPLLAAFFMLATLSSIGLPLLSGFVGEFLVLLGAFKVSYVYAALGATDIAMTALKLQESDTSGSGQADITGLVYGTSTNTDGDTSALPTDAQDGLIFGFDVDLRGRKRFLPLIATAGDGSVGSFLIALALLAREEDGAATAALRGCAQMLRV